MTHLLSVAGSWDSHSHFYTIGPHVIIHCWTQKALLLPWEHLQKWEMLSYEDIWHPISICRFVYDITSSDSVKQLPCLDPSVHKTHAVYTRQLKSDKDRAAIIILQEHITPTPFSTVNLQLSKGKHTNSDLKMLFRYA